MKHEVHLTRKARKELEKLDPRTRERILNALIMLRDYGFTQRLDIKKLRGYKIGTTTGLGSVDTASYSSWRNHVE